MLKRYSDNDKKKAEQKLMKAYKPEKYFKVLEKMKKEKSFKYLEELDKDTDKEFLLNALIYHYLKDLKKIKSDKESEKLEYLKQLYKGKPCDLKNPCDEGFCDLRSMKCLDETKEDYYENIKTHIVDGKYFVGTQEFLDKAFPKSKKADEDEADEADKKAKKEAKKEAKEAKAKADKEAAEAEAKKAKSDKAKKPEAKPEDEAKEEEVDLDIDVKDLGKLSELQRALIECLMPAGK